jgi:putative tryptophan/tyrosine transport system substrate-binding protein
MAINIARRKFIAAFGGAAAAWPLVAPAQQSAGRNARIGLLQTSRDNPVVGRGYPAFLDELKKSGFSAGQNLAIEVVRTDQDSQRLFAETADLVRSNVELLVAEGSEIVLKAARAASRTIPIVISATNYDPIARGYVKSLARPGGNITGIVSLQTELAAKQVELLAEAFPDSFSCSPVSTLHFPARISPSWRSSSGCRPCSSSTPTSRQADLSPTA